jgi:hypothetical protein
VGINWSVSLLPVHSAGCAALPSVFEGGLPRRLQGRVRLPPEWAPPPGAGALGPPLLGAGRGRTNKAHSLNLEAQSQEKRRKGKKTSLLISKLGLQQVVDVQEMRPGAMSCCVTKKDEPPHLQTWSSAGSGRPGDAPWGNVVQY